MNLPNKAVWVLAYSSIALLGSVWLPSDTSAQTSANPARPAAEQGPPPDLMMVHGRLSIKTPSQPFHLGEENALTISLKGPPVAQLVTMQREASADGLSPWIEGSDRQVSVQHRPDGSAYLSVVPQRLGTIDFQLNVDFADGGFEQDSVSVPVIAVEPPRKLQVEAGWMFRSSITLDLSKRWGEDKIWVAADYPGLKSPLNIPLKDARFKVSMAKGEPPIRFDPITGEIDALRLGKALIETTYRGLTVPTCVVVTEDSEWGAYRSNCDELKQGGMSSNEIVEAMLAENHSELPYGPLDGRKGRFMANDRIEIVVPPQPLNVAEDNAIVMKVHGSTVARVECDSGNTGCTRRYGYTKPPLPFTFQQQGDGNVLLRVFPGTLGAVEFSFSVFFADGGVAHKTLPANVGFGTKQPRGINMPCGNDSYGNPNLPQEMVAQNPGWQGSTTMGLWINACFDGIPGFVVIPPKELTYRVLSEGDKPAISVDSSTGQVTALEQGQALLEREFRGLKTQTCFVVAPSAEPYAGDLSNCRDLRAKYGAPLPEPPPHPNVPHIPEIQRAQAIEDARLSPHVEDRFDADERLEIPIDGVSLPLGEPAKLPIRITGPEVLRTMVLQKLVQYNGNDKPSTFEDMESFDTQNVGTIEHAADGSPFVTVVARRPGMAEFRFSLLFADGGVATRMIEVPVKVPDHTSLRLTNASDGHLMDSEVSVSIMHLLMHAPDNVRWLYPFAWIDQGNWPIALGPGDVTVTVQQASDPVVRLDPATRAVTALRPGHALVRTQFAGAESETCVVVMANATEGDPSNCDELRGKR